MRFKYLFLDLDGTLLDFERSEALAFVAAFAGEGLFTDDAMYETYRAINNALWDAFEQGMVTKDHLVVERFRRFLAHYDSPVDPAYMNEVYINTLSFTCIEVPGARELLEALAGKIPMALVTNGVAKAQYGRVKNARMAPFFEHVFISEEIGAQKPDPIFFKKALEACGNPDPAEVLIVGDSLSADMRGGISSGLKTCWFNPKGLTDANNLPIDYTIDALDELLPIILGEDA